MEIIRLPLGETAPHDADCISIDEAEDGRFLLNTSTLEACADEDEAESASVISSAPYDSYEAAEAAGLAIAAEQCVPLIYISRQSGLALQRLG